MRLVREYFQQLKTNVSVWLWNTKFIQGLVREYSDNDCGACDE